MAMNNKNNNNAAIVFGEIKTQVNELDGKVNTLGTRVNKLENQPPSGNSSGTPIVSGGNVTMNLDEKNFGPIFVKAITDVLEKRDALRRAQEAKDEAEGKVVSLAQLTQNCINGWDTLKEHVNKDVQIHNNYYDWYIATVKILGISYDQKTKKSGIIKDSFLDNISNRQETINSKINDVSNAIDGLELNPTVVYTFEPWPATKTFLRYIFQWKFWSDARVFMLVVFLLTSIFVNVVAYKHMNKWKNTEVKYELLYRIFSHSKNFTQEVQYLEKLFEEPERNKEAIDKLREMNR
jgi:hypothetical protein